MNTKSHILNQFQTYPQLELQDLMKFLYQSSFGCEHLLSNPDTVKKQIQQELDTKLDTCNSIEYLDGDYVRLHLNYGLSVNTLSTRKHLAAACLFLNMIQKVQEPRHMLV